MLAPRAFVSIAALVAVAGPRARAAELLVAPGESIQAAIDVASSGDVIVVAAGSYSGAIDFAGKAITVRSAEGADVTIIDGAGVAGSGVVRFDSSEGRSSILEGFTIRGGVTYAGGGGALAILASAAPVIRSCAFEENAAHGAYAPGGAAYVQGSPIFESCRFRSNACDTKGGAVYVDSGEPLFVGCTFEANTAGAQGGAICTGLASAPNIIGCTFDGNEAALGGAVRNWTWGMTAITSSLFRGNTGASGGAVSNGLSAIVIGASEFCESVPDHVAGAVADQGDNTFADACVCLGDLDGNDTIGWNDLSGLLVSWGQACSGCAGDIDRDGTIGFGDLIQMLVAWGACA